MDDYPDKKKIYRLAEKAGGISSRYGKEFGFNMSPLALQRFFVMAQEDLQKDGKVRKTCDRIQLSK